MIVSAVIGGQIGILADLLGIGTSPTPTAAMTGITLFGIGLIGGLLASPAIVVGAAVVGGVFWYTGFDPYEFVLGPRVWRTSTPPSYSCPQPNIPGHQPSWTPALGGR